MTVIAFPPKTQRQFIERTLGVAWVTARAGGYARPNGVNPLVEKDLREAGYRVERQLVRRSMQWLTDEGYALMVVNGRRTQEFILAPDVQVPEPQFVQAKHARTGGRPAPAVVAEATPSAPASSANGRVIDDHGAQPMLGVRLVSSSPDPDPVRRPRLPNEPKEAPGPARLAELDRELRAWHASHPEAADEWIADVLETLT